MEIQPKRMIPLTCTCCGAKVNRNTYKCEYCGTEYRRDTEIPTIRLETFTNPVKVYRACALVNREEVMRFGNEYMEHCIRHLANEMLPAIVDNMEIRTDYDPALMQYRMDGTLRCVHPVNVSDRFY